MLSGTWNVPEFTFGILAQSFSTLHWFFCPGLLCLLNRPLPPVRWNRQITSSSSEQVVRAPPSSAKIPCSHISFELHFALVASLRVIASDTRAQFAHKPTLLIILLFCPRIWFVTLSASVFIRPLFHIIPADRCQIASAHGMRSRWTNSIFTERSVL